MPLSVSIHLPRKSLGELFFLGKPDTMPEWRNPNLELTATLVVFVDLKAPPRALDARFGDFPDQKSFGVVNHFVNKSVTVTCVLALTQSFFGFRRTYATLSSLIELEQ